MDYQVVEIKNPVLNINDSKVYEMFNKLIKLKIMGYQYEYGNSIMPIGAYDFLSNHIAICTKEANGDLNPIAMFETLRYSTCKEFKMSFPHIELTMIGGNHVLSSEIQKSANKFLEHGSDILYDSSWTVTPEQRQKKNISSILRLVLSLGVNLHLDSDIKAFFVSATLKVGTDKIFKNAGCVPVSDSPYYKLANINNQNAEMFLCCKFSNTMLKLSKMYSKLWTDRIILGK